jgi:hypothetical protein
LSYSSTLQSLEKLLESFLERAVAAKGRRLEVLDGINRLDDIARASHEGRDIIESIGEWFAEQGDWLEGNGLRSGDFSRLDRILAAINSTLSQSGDSSPAASKILSELDRWSRVTKSASQKLVLKRGSEAAEPGTDSILLFGKLLDRLVDRYDDLSRSKEHLLSVLDDSLQSAQAQKSMEALLLSAFIVYYLKQNSYKVDPYVRRLKEAEALIREERQHA